MFSSKHNCDKSKQKLQWKCNYFLTLREILPALEVGRNPGAAASESRTYRHSFMFPNVIRCTASNNYTFNMLLIFEKLRSAITYIIESLMSSNSFSRFHV